MILTVASGKGGTGKTTLAVALAQLAARHLAGPVELLDADVEAPNAALFLEARIDERRVAAVPIPHVDESACTHCGRCVELCRYHAIADLGTSMLVFPDLCLACGVCARHCPENAIVEQDQRLGVLEAGRAGAFTLAQGRLDIGRAQATPLIRQLKRWRLSASEGGLTIIDAPPGSACPVLEAARGADLVLLVAEPSPFGLHDLDKAVGALGDALCLPLAVVINRSRGRDEALRTFCRERSLPILATIPFSREIAEGIAGGAPLLEAEPTLEAPLRALLTDLVRLAQRENVA